MRDALNLYQKPKSRIKWETVVLRPWQDQLEKILKPSYRYVYWIVGVKGNEGKSWFQDYLLAKYGYDRSVHLDVCSRSTDIFYALSHRPLQTTDVFIFNDARSQDDLSYITLEQIKDGRAMSTKYCSRPITFKRPNIVIVFSNRRPVRAKLSEDRWLEYHITVKGELRMERPVRSDTETRSIPVN